MAQRTKSIEDSLSKDSLRQLVADLDNLPTPEQFKSTASDSLWRSLTGTEYFESDSILYEELENSDVIGFVESEDGSQRLPWWLTTFEWKIDEPGLDELHLDSKEDLERLRDYDPTSAKLKKPEINPDEAKFVDILSSFKTLQSTLEDHVDYDESVNPDTASFPEDIFTVSDGVVETTDDFEEWFDEVVDLCPPINEQLTALLMACTRVNRQIAEDVLQEDVIEALERAGLADEENIFNQDYYDALRSILQFDRIFDWKLESENEALHPFEYKLYDSWVERFDGDREVREWLETAAKSNKDRLEPEEERKFASAAFRAPLWLYNRRPVFVPLETYPDEERKNAIKSILSSEGVIHEDE